MITRDLFELASLDVLGLLDEDERRDFEQAFREAPPAVQSQIRREQLRVTDIDDWLPPVETPASLKPRVLTAVREAIDAVRAGQGRQHVSRKFGPLAVALQRSVSPLWRAAAVGFAAATLVAGYQFLRAVDQVHQVTRIMDSEGAMTAISTQGGAKFVGVLSDKNMNSVAFAQGPGAVAGKDLRAGLYSAAGKGAYLACSLPRIPGGYRLVVLSDDGKSIAREIATLDPAAGQQIITINETIPAGTKLAILPQSAGDDLSSAVLISRA
jgi:hypothetical protein